MVRVQVESPFAGKTPEEAARNKRYLAACLRDCIERCETPYASHRMLTMLGVLRDDVPAERERGIVAGFAMRWGLNGSAFYVDLGWSSGMISGWSHAAGVKADRVHLRAHMSEKVFLDYIGEHEIEVRVLGGEWVTYGLTNKGDPR